MQEDAQTRSSDHAHAGETRVVWELTVARGRRHFHGHGAGAEVASVAAGRRSMAHRRRTRWKEGKAWQGRVILCGALVNV
jgi:hypothetical protein